MLARKERRRLALFDAHFEYFFPENNFAVERTNDNLETHCASRRKRSSNVAVSRNKRRSIYFGGIQEKQEFGTQIISAAYEQRMSPPCVMLSPGSREQNFTWFLRWNSISAVIFNPRTVITAASFLIFVLILAKKWLPYSVQPQLKQPQTAAKAQRWFRQLLRLLPMEVFGDAVYCNKRRIRSR